MEQENGSKKQKEWEGLVIAGKYVVKKLIGEGGMGVVLEAENTVIQLPVAIKLLHNVLAQNENAMKRFQQEARTATATGHAHIVEIYDMGETEDGSPFIVMELLKGGNLQQLLRQEKALDPFRAARICIQLLSALSVVHAREILHRDLKPANVILISGKGKKDFVKLVDFGISKIHEHRMEQKHLTATGVVMGTPHYMSPEQARGEKEIDHRADLYAVGAILYRCVSGRVPYPGKNYNQILARILAEPPPPVKEIRPETPLVLSEIISKAMARRTDDRYKTAAAFASDLAEFCNINISVSSSDLKRVSYAEAAAVRAIDEDETATAETIAAKQSSKELETTRPIARISRSKTPVSSGSWKEEGSADVDESGAVGGKDVSGDIVSRTEKLKPGGTGRNINAETMDEKKDGKEVSSKSPVSISREQRRHRFRWWMILGGGAFALAATAVFMFVGGRFSKDEGASCPLIEFAIHKRPVVFVLGQHMSAEDRKRIYSDATEFLKKRLRRPIKIETPEKMWTSEDLDLLGRKLLEGKFDLLAISPMLYVELKEMHPEIEVLAMPRFQQAESFQGLILAREEDKITGLQDFKGRTFCWVSKNSTSGYLFPRMKIRSEGLDPDNLFSETIMAGSHKKALNMLQEGKCDGAAVYGMSFQEHRLRREIYTPLRTVTTTDPIPSDAICVGPGMDKEWRSKILETLLEFDRKKHGADRGSELESVVSSFIKADDSVYDTIRRAIKEESAPVDEDTQL